jgi:hypothetical protein
VQRGDRSEVKVVGNGDPGHGRALAGRVPGELEQGAGEGLVVRAAGGGREDDPCNTLGRAVRDLETHRAAERVSHEDDAFEF